MTYIYPCILVQQLIITEGAYIIQYWTASLVKCN